MSDITAQASTVVDASKVRVDVPPVPGPDIPPPPDPAGPIDRLTLPVRDRPSPRDDDGRRWY
jgi:hypothetical protein